jgi:hypothetical protein
MTEEAIRSSGIACARKTLLERQEQLMTEQLFSKQFDSAPMHAIAHQVEMETQLQRPRSKHAMLCSSYAVIEQRGGGWFGTADEGDVDDAWVGNSTMATFYTTHANANGLPTAPPLDCSVQGNVCSSVKNECCPGYQSNLLFNNMTRRH